MTTRIRIIRCHCPTCDRPYTRWRMRGDVRPEPDPRARCAACVGATLDYVM